MRCSSRSLRRDDLRVREARLVEHLARLDATGTRGRRSRAGCRPARGPLARSSRPTVDRVAHALERVVGVDEEHAVVGHRLGVRAERLELVAVEHHPAVRVRAAHRDAEQLAGEHVRRRRAAADVRRARLAESPPSMPCARRRPNSSTGVARAPPGTTRAALVAISVWKLTMSSSAVSRSCACRIGPRTRSSGSCGNTSVPSGTASTSQVNRSVARGSRGSPASNSGCAVVAARASRGTRGRRP